MPPGVLNGVGSGTGQPVYARAALLGEETGRPTIDARLLSAASRQFAQGDGATDIVLVARDAAIAVLVPLPTGITLAGVIAEQSAPPTFAPNFPVVTGVVGALRQIADGELVILDAERGRVSVEPAPEEFALLQAERRRPRLFIAGAHTPARTQAGRQIAVWAIVRDDADLDAAQENGADGVLIDDPSAFLPEDDEGEVDARPLLRVADRMGGGDLGLLSNPDEIDASALLALAARADVRWIVHPEFLTQTPRELVIDLEQYARDAAAEPAEPTDSPPADETAPPLGDMPRLCALISTSAAEVDFLPPGFGELFLMSDALDDWAVTDTFGRPPLRIVVGAPPPGSDEEDELTTALGKAVLLDIAGLVVSPAWVAGTKDFIRDQAY